MTVTVAAAMLVWAAMFRLHGGRAGLAPLAALVLGLALVTFVLMSVLRQLVGAGADERATRHDPVDHTPT